jgi:hypothetical protein
MNSKKESKTAQKLNKRQAALQLLVNSGYPLKDASRMLGYSYHGAGNIISLKKLRKLKFSEDKEAQNIANRTIKSLAAGLIPADSAIETVKDSTALDASKYLHSFIESNKAEEEAASTISYPTINFNFDLINSPDLFNKSAKAIETAVVIPAEIVEGDPQPG